MISTYYNDPFGRRLWKEVDGVCTYFVYADEGLVAEVDVAGNVVKSYGYKPGSTWTTDPLFMKVGGQYYFYQNDHLGTPQKLTAANGAVVWAAKYSSFGEAYVDPTSTIVNNLRFPGQYWDEETGLHYNYFRYYDPSTGRYITPDPMGMFGGINPFVYVQNNFVNMIDVFGLWGEDVHYGNPNSNYGTYTWARQAGFTENGAQLIATGNNSVDWFWGSSPLTGNQARHFNQFSTDDFCDSREYYAEQELREAVRLFREGREDQALGRLGMGLHSLQDLFAHRDWDTGPLGIEAHPSWYDDWNDPRNADASRLTEEATRNYLNEFIRLTYSGYTH